MNNHGRLFGIVLGFILLSGASPAQARQITHECHSFDQPKSGKYCVTTTVGSTNPDVLFLLHGKDENENAWLDLPGTREIAAIWEASGIQAPRVVTISFGSVWMLNDKELDGSPGLLPLLADEIMPRIEKEIGGIQGRRLLMGDSMGGFNASELLLKRGHRFSRVVLACPAITTVSPYSSFGKMIAYIRRTHANFWNALEAFLVGRWFFPTKSLWNNAAPLALARSDLDSTSPPIHVSVGAQDEYGFFEGAQAFAEIAAERGVQTTWKLIPGPHCVFDSPSIAQFLTQ